MTALTLLLVLLLLDHRFRSSNAATAFSADLGAAEGGCVPSQVNFSVVASFVNTDKDSPTGHHYSEVYDRYLQPIRCTQLRMLEIGLGCGYGKFGGALGLLCVCVSLVSNRGPPRASSSRPFPFPPSPRHPFHAHTNPYLFFFFSAAPRSGVERPAVADMDAQHPAHHV